MFSEGYNGFASNDDTKCRRFNGKIPSPTLPRCMKHGAKTVLELFKQSMGLGTEQE
jgi:hypothetical protein